MAKIESTATFEPKGFYNCPVCHHGQIEQMPLMEVMSCNFCHHIFTPNFEQQLLKIADSQLPLTWRWNGKRWQGVQQDGTQWGWGYLVAAIAFIFLPTTIVAISAYLFPPLPDSPLAWLPTFWIGLTFAAHAGILGWLMVEYYQFPIRLYVSAMIRRRLLQRS